jgi:hypothetical protein
MPTSPADPILVSSVTVEAFKAAQAPLINLLRSHMEDAYENEHDVPRVVVLAYLAGQDRNMELLNA